MAGKAERLHEQVPDEVGRDFLFLYQKAVLRALQRQGILNEGQLQVCIEKLGRQMNDRG